MEQNEMNTTTRIFKGRSGWQMESAIELADNRQLTVLTMKRHDGRLITSASVGVHDNGFICHRVHQDFSRRLIIESVRVTEKAVGTQHQQALDNIESLLAEITEFYETA
jgi:hypothetical protein